MDEQKATTFHQKYLNLWSEDERKSYLFIELLMTQFSFLGELTL